MPMDYLNLYGLMWDYMVTSPTNCDHQSYFVFNMKQGKFSEAILE
jgi:hypothetical protein